MAMNPATTQTDEEILRAGYDALARELGVVGMIRFLQQIRPGKGDYTAERQQPDTLDFEEIQATLASIRAAEGDDATLAEPSC
jgi:hypothetical protein